MRPYLLFVLISPILIFSGCATSHLGHQDTQLLNVRYAFMSIEWDGYSSAAKIWQQGHKLRMEVLSGRTSNVMLVDYQNDKALLLIPSQGKYQRYPIERLNQSLPHFFDPKVKLDRVFLGEETLSGHPANKYQIVATARSGKKQSGTLWLSKKWQGFPLQWVADNQKVSVTWDNLELQKVSPDWFQVPAHYLNLNANTPQPGKQQQATN